MPLRAAWRVVAAAPPSDLDDAILTENASVVQAFLMGMADEDAREALQRCCRQSWVEETGLVTVARKGNVPMLLGVLSEACRRLGLLEVGP